jgi:hypothetical protein
MAKRKHSTVARDTTPDEHEVATTAASATPASTARQLSLPLADTLNPPEDADVISGLPPASPARTAARDDTPRLASATAATRRAKSALMAEAGTPEVTLEGSGLGAAPRPVRRSGPRVQEAEDTQRRETHAREAHAREAHTSVRACFRDLRVALEDGWEIVQPIFARPLWSVADNSATAFNFVLRRERATRLVTVPEGRTVQRFIRDHHLTVDYRQ